jgi:hypothetical protein
LESDPNFPLPFLRTTDIVDLELRRDPRHCVDQQVYDDNAEKAGVQPSDVLLVRDGTYLVGSSALVGEDDGKNLICGGIYRLRSTSHSVLGPASLVLALNLPTVRKQLRAVQFTRDVIDTLGKRALEIFVPPLTNARWQEIGARVATAFRKKALAKSGIGKAIQLAEPPAPKVVLGRPSWSMR